MAVTARVVVDEMDLADIPAVHEIERQSFRSPWPSYAFRQELTGNRMAHYVVARVGGQVAGYAGLWQIVDEGHITTFGVHPRWRRQGIGRRLLLHLTELSRAIGARRMTLEVRASNEPARTLYAQFGFREAGVRRHYYSDDGEDALVMTTPALDDPAHVRLVEAIRRRLEPG